MANRFKVTVLGNAYYISTDDPESQVRQVEAELTKQIDELLDLKPNLSVVDALVILALNLTDEMMKNKEATDRMREQLTQYLEDAARTRIEVDAAKSEVTALRRENEKLKAELDRRHG